ncbi:DNA-binding protein inhibitor ID-3 [Fukomys damarensis]|uniref:DNA-binding protein inhibitor ID-3 n=1 Tax=Fukomys damarensis TaxID=885580 RepID=A0A091DQJ3_FUKDA|nr:DNA-binding protein inhibitor ID-3 [Fukomys damarensis]
MKALSPVRGCYEAVCCLSERSLAIARGRGKSPAAEEPLSLLDDMNHCYSRLRELVPGVPRGTQLSQVEILQRVIDYILDLQVVLAEPAPGPPDGPHLPIQNAGAGTRSAWDLGTLFGRKLEGMDEPQPRPAHFTSPDPYLEVGPGARE